MLLEKIKRFKTSDVVVACVRQITYKEVANGKFTHLGLRIQEGKLFLPPAVVPEASRGRYSKFNVHGQVLIRKDQPKVIKSITITVPNFGDWSKGSHDITWTRMVYRRDFLQPHELELKMEVMEEIGAPEPGFLVKFTVDEVLSVKQPDFKRRLLSNINLLHENVGAIEVFPSDATRSDYLHTVVIDWEILPVGAGILIANRLVSSIRRNRAEVARTIASRQKLLEGLGPVNWIIGTSGFRRYFGAKFNDNLVVFENIEYGNAVYVMFENWAAISKLSRLDLLNNYNGFVRIIHKPGWEEILQKVVRDNSAGPQGQKAAA